MILKSHEVHKIANKLSRMKQHYKERGIHWESVEVTILDDHAVYLQWEEDQGGPYLQQVPCSKFILRLTTAVPDAASEQKSGAAFLCTSCRQLMCQGCRDIADEYRELERNRAQAQYFAENRAEELHQELEQARRRATMWERLAKVGFPEVMRRWMNSLSAGGEDAET